jgi:hypothetical protein
LSLNKFCQEEATILLEVLRPAIEKMVSSCSKSEGDFFVVESAVSSAMEAMRSPMVSHGLDISTRCCSHNYVCPKCSQSLTVWGQRDRQVVTSAGSGKLTTYRYRCARCEDDYYPIVEANGLVGGQFTLGAKERIVTEASESCYAKVSRDLPKIGIDVSAKEVDRQVREAGELLRGEQDKETEWHRANRSDKLQAALDSDAGSEERGLAGAAPDAMFSWAGWEGQTWAQVSVDGAKARSPELGRTGLIWFDVRTGLIRPVADRTPALTFHTSGVMSWDKMFDRLFAVWQQRPHGLENLIFVSDDGAGIKAQARSSFPNAIIATDLYHASEHLGSAAAALWGQNSEEAASVKAEAVALLKRSNGPRALFRQFFAAVRSGPVADEHELRTNLLYLWRNRHQMKYEKWHDMGLPIGSGAVESAIKQICVKRLRGAGMKWTRDGADCILHVRAACISQTKQVAFARERERALQAYRRFLPSKPYKLAV